MSRIYDNWERLVAAVLKRDQIWQLCHDESRSPSMSSMSSDFSLSFRLSDVNLQESEEKSIQKPIHKLIFLGGSGRGFSLRDTFEFCGEMGKGTFGTTKLTKLLEDVEVSDQEFLGEGTKYVTKLMNDVRMTEEEFKQHMEVLGNCRHENVGVPRAYYFSNKPNKTFAVYDYHSQRSVSAMLHHGRLNTPPPLIVYDSYGHRSTVSSMLYEGDSLYLSWKSRCKIAIGAARGIAHIHTQCGGKLAHGNIKSSNVFPNSQQYGCVSDFGFAGILVKPPPIRDALGYHPQPYYSKNPSQEYDVRKFGLNVA